MDFIEAQNKEKGERIGMLVRLTKESVILLMVLSIVVSLMVVPLPIYGGYQFSKPSTVWADDFRNGLDPSWGNHTSGSGTLTISNTIKYSTPNSLRMNSSMYTSSSAYAVGPLNKMIPPNSNGSLSSIDYSKNYTVQLYFYLPKGNNHWIVVFLNRHISTVIDTGTDFTYRYDDINTKIVTLNTATWYRITYWVDVTHSKYYVDVYNTATGSLVVTGYACNFQGGGYTDPFMLGDLETGTLNYGEAYWDDLQINFVSPKSVVFRLLAVEGYAQYGNEIPCKNFTEYGGPDYSKSNGQQVPLKSSQYLILALTKFTNWQNCTWDGVKYTSYIHLLSYDPNRFAATNIYYKGESTRANVVNEIQNFLGQNDPNAYTVRVFHYGGHGGSDGKGWFLSLGKPANPENLYDSDLNTDLNSGALKNCSSVLVILDCCNSGGFIQTLAKAGRVILTACNPGEKAGAWGPLQAPAPAPGYWGWFTGNERAPLRWEVGIINALFKATDADNDGWLTAGELFGDPANGAFTTTNHYFALQGALQTPQKSYGVVGGELPVVMSSPWYWSVQWNPNWDPSQPWSQRWIYVKTQTGFHINALNITVQPPPPSKSWSSFHSDMDRSGFGFDPPLLPLSLLWNTSLLSPIESSVVTREEGVIASRENGVISMLDIRTGKVLWSLNLNGTIFSTPTIMNGTVFVGTMGGGGGSGSFGCLYAIDFSTGTVRWTFQLPPQTGICSSPAVSDGRCIVGTIYGGGGGGGWICAFNQTTGMPLWNYTTYTPIWSSPAVADGRVIFAEYGSPSHPATVYALDEINGTLKWDLMMPTGSLIVSSPAVCGGGGAGHGGGMVFIGTKSMTPPPPSLVVALNESSGSVKWIYPTVGPVSSSPAFDPNKGLVVVGDEGGNTYGLNQSSGGCLWSRLLSPYPINMSSAAISNNGLVFIGSTDHRLYCFNETNGQTLWNYTTGGRIVSSPAIVGDHVLIGSSDGKVYCFGPPFPLHDVAVTSGSASPTVVTAGGLVTITSTVANNGNVPETFNVTFSYNNTQIWNWPVYSVPTGIGSNTVTLGPGATLTTTYSWNTAGMQRGRYTVVVIADFLTDETNVSNNILFTNMLTIMTHDVAVVSVDNMKSGCVPLPTVGQGKPMDVYVTVKDTGDFTETFNVTAYANTTIIGKQKVTLNSGQNTTLTFTWNTTGFVEYDNYTISATAGPVSGETNLADNTLTDGTVMVVHQGDVDGNGFVDTKDIAKVAGAFGSLRVDDPKDPRYGQYWHPTPCWLCPHSPNADIDGNGFTDTKDLATTARNYGWLKP